MLSGLDAFLPSLWGGTAGEGRNNVSHYFIKVSPPLEGTAQLSLDLVQCACLGLIMGIETAIFYEGASVVLQDYSPSNLVLPPSPISWFAGGNVGI